MGNSNKTPKATHLQRLLNRMGTFINASMLQRFINKRIPALGNQTWKLKGGEEIG